MFRKKGKKKRYTDLINTIQALEANSSSLSQFPDLLKEEVKKEFQCMSYSQLSIIKSELITTLESDKRVISTSPIIVASLAFALPIYVSGVKGLLDQSPFHIQAVGSLLLSLIPMTFVLVILRLLKKSNSSVGYLSFLERLINEIISERDIWNEAHKLAYSEYLIFLKNREKLSSR